MNANSIATLLSLFVLSASAYAAVPNPPSTNSKPPLVLHKIDINSADARALTGSVKGIGKKRAEAIIAYRQSHHGFKSLEELAEVKGFGPRFVTKNRIKLNEVFTVNKIE
jgi:competence protein ComEA